MPKRYEMISGPLDVYTAEEKRVRSLSDSQEFAERSRRVLAVAEAEAHRLKHDYVGTEHILLGLVKETDNMSAKVLLNLGVDLGKLRSAVEFIIGDGEGSRSGVIGLTPRAKKVIEMAVDEAFRQKSHYIGTEHLLIGLMRDGEGVAAGVLEVLRVSVDKLREEAVRLNVGPVTEPKAPSMIKGLWRIWVDYRLYVYISVIAFIVGAISGIIFDW